MAKPLTAEEAYAAGKHDFASAANATRHLVDGLKPDAEMKDIFAKHLAALWMARIKAGELPPVTPEKAS